MILAILRATNLCSNRRTGTCMDGGAGLQDTACCIYISIFGYVVIM